MTTVSQSGSAQAIAQACRLIEEAETAPSLDRLAQELGMTRFRFYRMFVGTLGITPKAYALAHRRKRLQDALPTATAVAEAVFDAGYGSGSRVYEKPDALLGMTPAAYRRGAPGVLIRSAIAQTGLGWLIVAATTKGVCMIEFGDSRQSVDARLRERFPRAVFQAADATLQAWLQQIIEYVRRPSGSLDLPLDIQGTAFQQQVWKALQTILPGETVSYSEVARRVGKPDAVRAVARAIASNGVALAVPCHRVLGSDGKLRGYRWGLQRKQALIDGERAANVTGRKRVRR